MDATSGCAFSSSSKSTTQYGRRRTGSVSWPGSSWPAYPGGAPSSRDTVCGSVNSARSMRTNAASLPKSTSASVFASSVLPTPLGPRKRKLPSGLRGSCRPVRARRMASETAAMARSCPMTRLDRSRSRSSRRLACDSVSESCGIAGPARDDRRDVVATDARPLHGAFVGERDGGGGLVDEIDRLVGQETIGDEAGRELRGRLDRLFVDDDVVVTRVALAQAAQDLDRFVDARLFDHDRLEAALERGVGLDVLAILVERRGADALQIAARQLRLDHRAQVERCALGGAGTDERVQLVDEEHDVARAALDFVEDALDAALEFAAVLRAGDERAERERENALPAQRVRRVAGDDARGETLDDRRFADARLADETRIVLAAPRENRDDAIDLAFAPDDGIELTVRAPAR